MPIDGMFCRHLVGELNDALETTRVDKIHHPTKDELIFTLRRREGSRRLLFHLNPQRARVNLTNQSFENPAQPSMFCMLLRKRLTGAALTGIEQEGVDRIIYFRFAGTDDIGNPAEHTLVAELFGRQANLVLLQDGVVVEALKRADFTKARPIWPGHPYTPPPANGSNGISLIVARELERNPNPPAGPYLMRNEEGEPAQFSYIPLTHLGGTPERLESYSELLEVFYGETDQAQRMRQKTATLRQSLGNHIARLYRKLEVQRRELEQAKDREALRISAELILANKGRLERDPAAKGSSAYLLENYYDENRMLSIRVNPALGPGANAQKLYKSYQKAKNAANLLGDLISKGEEDLRYLESVEELLQRAQTQAEIDALRDELEGQGYCKPNARQKQKQKQKRGALPPLEYATSEGLRVLVGRNNLQNDQLSLKSAKANDLWFHVQGYPGSHVILCTEGREAGQESIVQAAKIAAWHSKVREGAVPVDYTPVRALKKPNGARPGKVIYHTYQTIAALAVPEEIEQLKI